MTLIRLCRCVSTANTGLSCGSHVITADPLHLQYDRYFFLLHSMCEPKKSNENGKSGYIGKGTPCQDQDQITNTTQ